MTDAEKLLKEATPLCSHAPHVYWMLDVEVIDTTEADGPEMQPRQSIFLECLHPDCHMLLRDNEILWALVRLLQVERAAKDMANDMTQYAEGLRMDANVGRLGAGQLNAIAGWMEYKVRALRQLVEGGTG